MHIALDAEGGDNAPLSTWEGAKLALSNAAQEGATDLRITLVGDPARILQSPEELPQGLDILPSAASAGGGDPFIDGENSDSPIRTALRQHRLGRFDAVVSAGSTGAQVIASILELDKCSGITRPAIGALFPTVKGHSFLLDVGASLTAGPHHLVQFAAMGLVYAREALGIAEPSIGLLNVGAESFVGERSVVEAHRLLTQTGFRYEGFVEGRDLPAGKTDVVVTNGQLGNVLLKFLEGLPLLLPRLLPEAAAESARRAIAEKLDYQAFGGEPLLGVKGVSVVCHGASGPRAIAAAIQEASRLARMQLHERIESFLVEQFDSYISQIRYLRSFRRSLRAYWRTSKPPEDGLRQPPPDEK